MYLCTYVPCTAVRAEQFEFIITTYQITLPRTKTVWLYILY